MNPTIRARGARNRCRTLAVLCVLAGMLAWFGPARAAVPVPLERCERVVLDERYLEVATGIDPGLDLSGVRTQRFVPADGARMNLGIGRDKVWLRFSVRGGACDEPMFLALGNPFVNQVLVHRDAGDGRWVREWSSDTLARGADMTRLRRAVAPIVTDTPGDYLVEVLGPGAVTIAPAIASGARLSTESAGRSLISGLLAGGIVALAIYCACLAALLRFEGLLSFSASALALGVYYASSAGMFDQFVVSLGNAPQAARHVVLRINGVAVVIAALFHWIFVRDLLTPASRRSRWATLSVVAASAAVLTMIPFLQGAQVARLCIAVGVAVAVAVSFELEIARRAGHPLARLTMTAFGTAAAALALYIGGYVGLLSSQPWLLDVIALGIWAETIMLSMAIGLHVKELRQRQQQLEARTAELSILSRLDQLTGLANRRAYDAVVPAQIAECQRRGSPMAMLVVDIDHFKRVNDAWGHGFGDSVIRVLGTTIANCIRSADFACRLGGEEFVALLPDIDPSGAHAVAERILREFTNCSPSAPDGHRPFLSVSIGLAPLRADDTHDTLFARADAAMYRAKLAGRCRIEIDDGTLLVNPCAPVRTTFLAAGQSTSAEANSVALNACRSSSASPTPMK